MRAIGLLLVLLTLSGLAVGSAATIGSAPRSIAAARVSVPRCTSAGLLVLPNLSGANVASVTISAIPASCGGATIQATVDNGTANSGGSATVPAAGGSVTVTLASAVAAATSQRIEVLFTGP